MSSSELFTEYTDISRREVEIDVEDGSVGEGNGFSINFYGSDRYNDFLEFRDWGWYNSKILGSSLGNLVSVVVDALEVEEAHEIDNPLYMKVKSDLALSNYEVVQEGFRQGFVDLNIRDISRSEGAILDVLHEMEDPVTAGDVVDYIQDLDSFNYSSNRGWVSNKLSGLAKKGEIGRYREGRNVNYMLDVDEALRNVIRTSDLKSKDKIDLLNQNADERQREELFKAAQIHPSRIDEYFEDNDDDIWKMLNSE